MQREGHLTTERWELADEPRIELKTARLQSPGSVHVESDNRRFTASCAGGDNSGLMIEIEMHVPAQQPRLVGTGVEQRLKLTASIPRARSLSFGEIAARATEGEVVDRG